ncbi:MAG: preprotein translocase subunit SecE [Sedimentisphaerales bacterium]
MNFSIYKNGQGKYTRMGTAGGGALLAAIGCLQLYRTLDASDVGLWVETMVPVVIFLAADFMIASEGEMKKVNWSSKQEIIVSTVVVISVVVILAVLLGAADFIFQLSVGWLVS